MGDASPDAASPGPKRLAQHHSGPDPTRGTTASLDELTYEVLKLHEQRNIDADYFKQIYNVTEDHGARITIAHKFMKSETARLKSDITLNATLANDNDAKIKEGLAHLEAQVISNGEATAELRKDAQGAVQGISQQVGATPTASSDPEIQSLRSRIEEVDRKSEHISKAVTDRCNEVLQRAEALVGSLRIEEVHRHLMTLDATLSQAASQLG